MRILLCVIAGYLVGSINPAYIISKIKGFDIREKGTGNAGASNVAIVLGKKAGVLTALFDILKAFAVTFTALKLLPDVGFAGVLAGCSCIMGHIFPFLMGFKGGKGLACIGGMVLAYNPLVFLILLSAELIIAFTADYISVVAPTGSVIFTAVYFFLTREITGTLILCVTATVIVIKHIPNFRRIKQGTETHLSFLWKKEKQ